MDFGTALIVIAGIGAVYSLRAQRIRAGLPERGHSRHETAQPLVSSAQQSPRERELQREVEQLRERVHVLERIATDGRQTRELADEIESLRGR